MGCCAGTLIQEQAHVVMIDPSEQIEEALKFNQATETNAAVSHVDKNNELELARLRMQSKEQFFSSELEKSKQGTPSQQESENQLQCQSKQVSQKLGQQLKVSQDMLVLKQCISEKFLNHYEIQKKIGEGGFGQVYLVKHLATGIQRAVKMILKSTVSNEEKLLEETEILRHLDHPNIVRILEIFVDFKFYYIVTEFCQGGELLDRIKSMTNFNEKLTSKYMKDILSAVLYCHKQNIVHRDLKPENILFDSKYPDANLKIIDFGASEKMVNNQSLTKKIGTPFYVAPEVISSDGYDEKVDVWSCGVILYILLSGRPPFRGKNEYETLKQATRGQLQFPAQIWGNISPPAIDLIKKMIVVDPSQRYSIEQAFNHNWIQKNNGNTVQDPQLLVQLQQFSAENKLRAAIYQFISVQLPDEEEQSKWMATFKQLDKDGDGTLNRQELLSGLQQIVGDEVKAAVLVDDVLREVDVNESGKIDFTEFISAAMMMDKKVSTEKLKQAFQLLDLDSDGSITKLELESVFGEINIDKQVWDDILQACDKDRDGRIQESEFLNLLQAIKF